MSKAKLKSYAKHLVESCPYCPGKPELVRGDVVYPHLPELVAKKFWKCNGCGAYVGCHDGTNLPLGRLADRKLREAKREAHSEFDSIWKSKLYRTRILEIPKKVRESDRGSRLKYRTVAYSWLAGKLGIPRRECHIGMFDLERCRQVVTVCREAKARYGESL